MAGSITPYETAAGTRYRVRYRKPDKSSTDKRGFKTKKEARLFLASVEVSKATGEYIDPKLSRVTVGALYETWIVTKKVLKPSAYDPLPRAWRNHVADTWSNVEIRDVLPSDVQAWLSRLSETRSASTTLRALGVLAGILDMAVDDGRIKKNPARGLRNRPRKPKKKAGRSYLTRAQLELLARCSRRPTLVRLLGTTGMRWSEAAALTRLTHDELRRRFHVERAAVTVNGIVEVGTVKSWEDRWVAYPAYLADEIRALCDGKAPRDLLFPGDDGHYLRRVQSGSGWFEGAVKRAQAIDRHFPRITPHDLRHTAASLAVQAGANVKALQAMLGHESAAMTLDTYADLFDDDLESVAKAIDKAQQAMRFSPAWEKKIIELVA